ncbi:MAG: choice-of-anchor L domain-containing protein [Bacteroidales bacterium]|jgi:hypothetical protein|nr:choice-of-anchor L domain-containing protein [Bacteroidales bacterium]
MKKRDIVFLTIVLFVLMLPICAKSQITVTAPTGTVKNLLRNYFLGQGIDLDTTQQIIFNGNTNILSNQIGIFTNQTTTAGNVQADSGIVMVTGNRIDASSGSHSGIESTHVNIASDGNDVSPALYNLYHGQGGTRDMNDIACLSFTIIPKNDQLSFKYVFASEEYPGFVCSEYNDIFGLFISGPYDNNNNLMAGGYQYHNIAVVPNSTTPVAINTVNGGVSAGSATPCILSNTQYFITNTNDNCKMNGYTVLLETEKVNVQPCYKYKLELALCNIGDHSYNSAVYLAAHSLTAKVISIDTNQFTSTYNKPYTKGCTCIPLKIKSNYTSETDITYNIAMSGSAVKGQDYELYDQAGDVVGSTLTITPGSDTAEIKICFLHNQNKAPLTIDTLKLVTEYVNDCTPQDTILLFMQEPDTLTHTLSLHNKTYCKDVLPVSQPIIANIHGAVGQANITWTYNGTTKKDTLYRSIPTNLAEILADTLRLSIYEDTPMPLVVYMETTDNCGRMVRDTATFNAIVATTDAKVSKDYICEGETVTLTCPATAHYLWTASPMDTLLVKNDTVQPANAKPSENTLYTVKITDVNGCVATDTVRVWVIPLVKARMYLNPKQTTLSNTNVAYQDITVDGVSRQWDFGEGTTSTSATGSVTYPTIDSGTYVVRLIAYNQANCADTAYDTVYVVPDFTLYIPNAFIPTNRNQGVKYFYPKGSMLLDWTMDVFNRWGEKIFSGHNQPWDGKLKNGDYAIPGTYVYVLYYKDGKNIPQVTKGTFTLLH